MAAEQKAYEARPIHATYPLVNELDKQGSGLEEDVSMVIQESLKPIQTSMDVVRTCVHPPQASQATEKPGIMHTIYSHQTG